MKPNKAEFSSAPPHFKEACADMGFTLIELSIVLVIIGLIVGGVLVGQDLIYAARLRKVGTELQQLSTAITTFRVKFDCLPGDCANATTFFGTSTNGCPTTTAGTSGTCNGNGDGFIEAWWMGGHGGATNVEAIYGIQQLSLAHMLTGTYLGGDAGGRIGGPSQDLQGYARIPVSLFNSGIGYYPFTMDQGLGYPAIFTNKITIEIGALPTVTTSQDFVSGPGFTAPQALALDSKIDDGSAGSGKIQSIASVYGASLINPNTTCLSSGAYSTSTSTGCVMFYAPDVP